VRQPSGSSRSWTGAGTLAVLVTGALLFGGGAQAVVPKGKLTIVFAGLPAGAKGWVVVDGPNRSRRIVRTATTLSVPFGEYRIQVDPYTYVALWPYATSLNRSHVKLTRARPQASVRATLLRTSPATVTLGVSGLPAGATAQVRLEATTPTPPDQHSLKANVTNSGGASFTVPVGSYQVSAFATEICRIGLSAAPNTCFFPQRQYTGGLLAPNATIEATAGQSVDVTVPFTGMDAGALRLHEAGFPAGTSAGVALETGSVRPGGSVMALPVGTYALREYRCPGGGCLTSATGATNGAFLRQTQATVARGEITDYTIQN
jgi:hypothetical protein